MGNEEGGSTRQSLLTLDHFSSPKKVRTGTKQGRNLEAGADAMRSAACSACFLYRTQDHQPRDGTTHKWLDPPLSITN